MLGFYMIVSAQTMSPNLHKKVLLKKEVQESLIKNENAVIISKGNNKSKEVTDKNKPTNQSKSKQSAAVPKKEAPKN